MKRIVEIKGAEGGQDAKLFAQDLATAYTKLMDRLSWKYTIRDLPRACIQIEVEGKDLKQLDNEAGGHRIQRVPPTERKGRVHTSSVTVSVIDPGTTNTDTSYNEVSDSDFSIEWFSGTGKGGQHRNKRKNCCKLIHIPTGLSEARQGRKRESNLREAKSALLKVLQDVQHTDEHNSQALEKKDQIGSGMRGDKIRTYRFQDDRVHDHNSNKKAKCSKIMKGHFDLLWR